MYTHDFLYQTDMFLIAFIKIIVDVTVVLPAPFLTVLFPSSQSPQIMNICCALSDECCYTFDFPKFPENVQTRMHFLYGDSEKAYKTCQALVRKAYPNARMTVFKGYAHLTYSAKNTEKYISLIQKEMGS